MTIHYSPAERGFFDSALHKELPADAVRITKACHRELIEAQAHGAQIVPDPESGRPIALFPDDDQLRRNLIAATKAEAERRIEAILPLYAQLNIMRLGGHAMSDEAQHSFAAIDAIRAASNAIEAELAGMDRQALETIGIAQHSLWPQDPS